jgi:flavin reductase (DIM6/NTAB) family NADH-FMN oxidoreductase RutF
MILQLDTMPTAETHGYLQSAIAPRPVCFASTIDKEGNVNLSPFSFFNLFSSAPPVVIFSPSRRVRDNTVKHTLENVLEVPEVVINIADYDMVQQVSLSSCEYPKGTSEFVKAGFTPEKAHRVAPPMVKESKIKLECRVLEVKALGTEGGAGNLVICEVLCMHIDDSILDGKGAIDQLKIQHIARLGGDWYCAVNSSNLFKVAKPNTQLGIGIDTLPLPVKHSTVLTGNDLGQLANVHEMPVVNPAFTDDRLKNIVQYYAINPDDMDKELHLYAAELLRENKVEAAWQVLLAGSL